MCGGTGGGGGVEIGIYFWWMQGLVPIFGPGGNVATLSFEFGTKHAERTV